eukprot:m.263598 g.263598  ORF g.263598 m.263598 type:complete len:62 (+) comp40457_c0_seq33:1082-1267(+)
MSGYNLIWWTSFVGFLSRTSRMCLFITLSLPCLAKFNCLDQGIMEYLKLKMKIFLNWEGLD